MLGALLLIGLGTYAAAGIARARYEDEIRAQNIISQRELALRLMLDECNSCACGQCPLKLTREMIAENADNLPVIINYLNEEACEHIYLRLVQQLPEAE